MGRFYRIRTHHGSILTANRHSGAVESVLERQLSDQTIVLLGYSPEIRDDACFLISSVASTLLLAPFQAGMSVLTLGITRADDGTVSFFDTDKGGWLCAAPPGDGAVQRGWVAAEPHVIDDYERYTLLPVSALFAGSVVQAIAEQIDALLARPFDLTLILAATTDQAAALAAVARLAPRATLEALANALLASPEACRKLAQLYPEDLYATHGLVPLADRVIAREGVDRPQTRGWLARVFNKPAAIPEVIRQPQPAVIGPQFDVVARPGLHGEYVSLPYACNAIARSRIVPGKGLSILATARNEGIYILEWLAYHRAIGVETVFLYTNNNDDGSDDLLAALAHAGTLEWVRSEVKPSESAQMKAYGHALALNPALLDHRWAMILDLDEYLMFNPALFRSATEYMQWHEAGSCDAIALNWIVHCSAGRSRWKDDFVARRFPFTTGEVGRHIKTACRPNRFIHARPHHPVAFRGDAFAFRAADRLQHMPFGEGGWSHSAQPNANFAWINHYFFKSADEFIWKWSRNRGDQSLVQGVSTGALSADFVSLFVNQFHSNHPAAATPDQCAPGFEAELSRLKALPGVAEAWLNVKRIYQARIGPLRTLFATAPGVKAAGEDGEKFIAILQD